MGGYEVACDVVARGLRRRGHKVAILTSDFGLSRPGTDAGDEFRLLHYGQGWPSLVQLARQEIADHRAFRRVLSSWKPDVIYAWCLLHLFPSLHLVLRAAAAPVVLNIQDSWLPQHLSEAECQRKAWHRSGAGITKRLGKVILRKTLKFLNPGWLRPMTAGDLPLDNIVFCSRFRLTEHDQLGLPSGRTRVIYNGIDTSIFTGIPGRASRGPLKVLFVGRLVEEKGAHTAVEAIRALRCRGCQEIRLSIVGVPAYPLEYSRKLQRSVEVDQLGDLVRFLGMVPHDALPEVYAQHDVLVFPSMINEGLPMTLIEAMACGLAVVGTTTGGSCEILKEGVTGLTFPPGDSNKLADCLQRLLNDQTLHRNLAIAGQRLAREQFNIETAVEQTESFLHEVVENHACHAELHV